MEFPNFSQVKCPACEKHSTQAREILLSLEARCKFCRASLATTGYRMHAMRAGWRTFLHKVEIVMHLEEKFGIAIPDEELDSASTVKELVDIACAKVSTDVPAKVVLAETMTALRKCVNTSELELDPTSSFYAIFMTDCRERAVKSSNSK